MFRSLVVPLDGSPLAAKALPYVAQVADPAARITLVGVVQPPLDELFGGTRRADIAEMMERSSNLLWREVETRAAGLRGQGLHVVTTVRRGDPAEEIIAGAQEARADLIVLTTHGWGGIRRWMLGSVANRLLHATAIPTLTIRVAEPESLASPPPIDGVIVPLDGSVFAEQTLSTAEGLARRLAVPIDLIRVVDDRTSLSRALPLSETAALNRLTEAIGEERTRAVEYLERIATPFTDAGCTVRQHVLVGDPATTLADAIDEHPHAVVVMATHGERGTARWVFGSVAEKIVSTASNPTLVLRPSTAGVTQAGISAEATAARYPD